MSIPDNKELYIKILHKVFIEKLQNDTGGHEEAIKNVCYCMALCHLFSAGLPKREPLPTFQSDFIPSFNALYLHIKCNHNK